MNYYCFLVSFHYHLLLHLCDSFPLSGTLYDFNATRNNQSSNKYCHSNITYPQILVLLSKTRCLSIQITNEIQNNNNRSKRTVDGGSIDIKALQATINDNRIMIEYLFNNTINQTLLAEALHAHARKAPSFSSWRDLVDILSIAIILIALIYFFICRIGLSPCDKIVEYLFRPILDRVEKKRDQTHRRHPTSFVQRSPKSVSQHIQSLDQIAQATQSNAVLQFH